MTVRTPPGIHAGVVSGIGRRIVRGELAAGEILPEQGELSRMLGVSRTVVREATKVLAAKGLVESRSKRGTLVLPRSEWRLLDPDVLGWLTEDGLDPEFLGSMFEVRSIIEPSAVVLAADRATPDDLAAIQAAFDAMATAPDEAAYLEADVRFHATLVAATHNDHLVHLVSAFGPALQAGIRAATQRGWDWPDFLEYSLGPHREVLGAVMKGDGAEAARAMAALVAQSRLSFDQPSAREDAAAGERGPVQPDRSSREHASSRPLSRA